MQTRETQTVQSEEMTVFDVRSEKIKSQNSSNAKLSFFNQSSQFYSGDSGEALGNIKSEKSSGEFLENVKSEKSSMK